MSIPSGLLAVLSLGPAYGSQLQAELQTRAVHRRQVNAGQVYATLDRLMDRGAITSAGLTEDGLPLYVATEAGLSEARRWLTKGATRPRPDWDEMLDQVLIACSIVSAEPERILADWHAAWAAKIEGLNAGETGPLAQIGASAAVRGARAAQDWIDEVVRCLAADPHAFVLERNAERPRRGRPAARSVPE